MASIVVNGYRRFTYGKNDVGREKSSTSLRIVVAKEPPIDHDDEPLFDKCSRIKKNEGRESFWPGRR